MDRTQRMDNPGSAAIKTQLPKIQLPMQSPAQARSRAIRWQFLVASATRCDQATNGPLIANSNAETVKPLCRVDMAHPLLPPNLPLCWHREVGYHDSSALQLVEPKSSSAPAVRSASQAASKVEVIEAKSASVMSTPPGNQSPSLGPSRPRMLDYQRYRKSEVSPPKHLGADPNNDENARQEQDWGPLFDLASPLAFDLQKPLSAAHRALQSIADKLRNNNHVSLEDARLLNATAHNLSLLSNWTDDVLLGQSTLQGECRLIRRRMRIMDWRAALGGLLESVAQQHSVHLEWIGWETTLPNLYLDPSLINKSFTNLASYLMHLLPSGGTLRISAGQLSGQSRHLRCTMEANSDILSTEMIQLINGSSHHISPSVQVTAIVTAKKLIEAHGGSLTAHRDLRGGCDLRITLPIDSAPSLVCSWLITNFQRGTFADQCFAHLYAVKLDGGEAESANIYLQKAAGHRALVIRVTSSRWLILELKNLDQLSSSSDTIHAAMFSRRSAGAKMDRAPVADGHRDIDAGSDKFNFLEQLVYRTQAISGDSLWANDSSNCRLPYLLEEIASKTHELMSRQQLVFDGYSPCVDNATIRDSHPHSLPLSEAFDGKGISIFADSAPPCPASVSKEPGAQLVGEIIRQWKIVQEKLAALNGNLAARQAG